MRKFIDIGVNLNDKMYKGIYRKQKSHQNDLKDVLDRAFNGGITKIIAISCNLNDSKEIVRQCLTRENLFMTVGCHPGDSNAFLNNPDKYMESLRLMALSSDKVVAIGECGLDYDREFFCKRHIQLPYFEKQVQLAVTLQLPLYLHSRAAHNDFVDIVKRYYTQLPQGRAGVVHTFCGTLDQANDYIGFGFYLGINGCSMKTEANINVVRQLPLDWIMIETDAPWCDIRPSYACYKYVKTFMAANSKETWSPDRQVKGRNEPANVVQVFEVLCAIRRESPDVICDTIFANTERLFWPKK